jgi:hypothetical protein
VRLVICTLMLLAFPAHAEVSVRKGQGTPAPTHPVSSTNLDAPEFQSDVRNLEAILDKEEAARITKEAAKKNNAQPDTAPEPILTIPANEQAGAGEENALSALIAPVRVFAIRWRDVFDILLLAGLLVYIRKLYRLSREQHKILSHAIRSAEYAASAAKRSAEICEQLMHSQQQPNENQHQLDL